MKMKRTIALIMTAVMLISGTAAFADGYAPAYGYRYTGLDVQKYVDDVVTPLYDVIRQEIHAGRWSRHSGYNGCVEMYTDGYGFVRRMTVSAGTDNVAPSRTFYFNTSGVLIFAYYENRNGEQQRAYILNTSMVRYKHTLSNGTVTTVDLGTDQEYRLFEQTVNDDCAYYLESAFGVSSVIATPETYGGKQEYYTGSTLSERILNSSDLKTLYEAELPENLVNLMCSVLSERLRSNIINTWNTWEHLVCSEYIGSYMFKGLNGDPSRVGVVFRNTVSIKPDDMDAPVVKSYYYSLTFTGFSFDQSGNWQLDTSSYSEPNSIAEIRFGNGHYCYYTGYDSLIQFSSECYNTYEGQYVRFMSHGLINSGINWPEGNIYQ